MIKKIDKNSVRVNRHKKIRLTLTGTSERPRLCVYRSSLNIYAQIIDDTKGITLVSAEVTMIPQNYVELTDETAIKNLQKTLDLLDADDDVQSVYHNWDE